MAAPAPFVHSTEAAVSSLTVQTIAAPGGRGKTGFRRCGGGPRSRICRSSADRPQHRNETAYPSGPGSRALPRCRGRTAAWPADCVHSASVARAHGRTRKRRRPDGAIDAIVVPKIAASSRIELMRGFVFVPCAMAVSLLGVSHEPCAAALPWQNRTDQADMLLDYRQSRELLRPETHGQRHPKSL